MKGTHLVMDIMMEEHMELIIKRTFSLRQTHEGISVLSCQSVFLNTHYIHWMRHKRPDSFSQDV